MPRDTQTALTDEELLGRYAAGEAAAARALTQRLAPRVLAHAYRLLGDRAEAEDVAQDAMLRLWRIAPEWRSGEAQVSTWLWRVTANLCTDRLRRRRHAGPPLDEVAEPFAEAPGAEARLQQVARAEALQAALMRLPERQRQAVVLRHIEGCSTEEIAAVMDIGVRAVESLTARGKRALAALLTGRREELGYVDDVE